MSRRLARVLLAALAPAFLATALWPAPVRVAVRVEVAQGSESPVLQPASLGEAVRSFVSRRWPSLLEVSVAGAGTATGAADAGATITLAGRRGIITAATVLAAPSPSRAGTRSTLPATAAASVVPTIAGDLAWLVLSSRGFAGLAPGTPPALAATLDTDALLTLAAWEEGGREPVGLAPSAEGVTILFPRRWLALGPLFSITRDTMRDLVMQPQPSPAIYTSITRATGGFTLAREDGSIEEVDTAIGSRTIAAGPGGAGSLAAALSASDVDAEGNRWSWDAQERRIRVTAADGTEVFSIRPLTRAEGLPVVQALAVTPDGGFLLGGSGELWKFYDTGVPAWRMSRLLGTPPEALPASFALAVDPSTGAFWLQDGPSHRIMAFQRGPAADAPAPAEADSAAMLAAHVGRMDARSAADLERAVELALAAGTPLAAWRFSSRLQRLGAPEGPAAAAAVELALMRDQAVGAAALVDALASDLLYARAAQAAQRGVELARALRDRDPADADAARLLDSLTARRRELRDASAEQADAPHVLAAARLAARDSACGGVLSVTLTAQAPASSPLADVRFSLGFPGLTAVPGNAALGGLAPGETGEVTLLLALRGQPDSLPAAAVAAGLASWQRTAGSASTALVLSVPIAASDPGGTGRLACVVSSPDPFIAAELAELAGDGPNDGLGALLALDTLAGLGRAARQAGGQPAGPGAPGVTAPLGPARSLLRSLPIEDPAWSIVVAAVVASLRQPLGLLPTGGVPVLVVDTGLDLAATLSKRSVPAATADLLRAISRSGTLCLPVAAPGAASAGEPEGIVRAIARGLGMLRTAGPTADGGAAEPAVAWITPGPARASGAGFALPIVLPVIPAPGGRERLRSLILSELEQAP